MGQGQRRRLRRQQPPTQTPVLEIGKQKIGTNAEYTSFEMVDEAGNVIGFDPDLMLAIAEAAGFEVELINTRWEGIFVTLASGEFDAIISAATITEEGAQTVDFGDPYLDAGQMIAVRADETEIRGVDDLSGKKVAVQLGTTGNIWLTEQTQAEVVRYDENTLAFQAVATGDVDAIVASGPWAIEIAKTDPEMDVRVLRGSVRLVLHAIKKGFLPIVTVIGLLTGPLPAGVILTETISSWPGMGAQIVSRILAHNHPCVQGSVMLLASVAINLPVCMSSTELNPRYPTRVGDSFLRGQLSLGLRGGRGSWAFRGRRHGYGWNSWPRLESQRRPMRTPVSSPGANNSLWPLRELWICSPRS